MKLYIVALSVAFCVASTPTADAKIKDKDLLTIESGENGGVILSFLVDRHCNSKQHFIAQNVAIGSEPIKLFLKDKLKDSKSNFKQRYGLHILPPGKYVLNGGECYAGGSNGYSITYYDDIRPWFKPFEVEAGKISFLGTITKEKVSYKVDGILDFVPDFIIKPPKKEYRIYSVEDDIEDVLKKMKKKYANAIPYVNKNIMELRLDGDVVKDIIRQSYTPKDGEKRVDGRKAERLLQTSLLKYKISGTK